METCPCASSTPSSPPRSSASLRRSPPTRRAARPIRLSDPGWTDITSTNSIAAPSSTALGYAPEVKTLSVPIGYQAMKDGQIDVFLGNWMPAQQPFRDDLDAAKAAEVIVQNLEGAKFTLAVPTAQATELGVADFKDLAAHADAFESKIYGIETGAPANQNLQKMIDAGDFGLGDWTLVESGEQAMLAQVTRAEKSGDAIVFLAWAPHPMNTAHELTYLAGGDAYFGPDYGGAQVFTLARTGWAGRMPERGALLQEPRLHRRHGERDDGQDPRRRRERPRRRRGLDQGEPRRARPLARGRHHASRRARPPRGPGRARPLTRR